MTIILLLVVLALVAIVVIAHQRNRDPWMLLCAYVARLRAALVALWHKVI